MRRVAWIVCRQEPPRRSNDHVIVVGVTMRRLRSVETSRRTEERRTSTVEHVVVPAKTIGVGGVLRQETQDETQERMSRTARHDGRCDVRLTGGRIQELAVKSRLLADEAAVARQQTPDRSKALHVQIGDDAADRVQRYVLAQVGSVYGERVRVVEVGQPGGEARFEETADPRVGPEPELERRIVNGPRTHPVGHLTKLTTHAQAGKLVKKTNVIFDNDLGNMVSWENSVRVQWRI